MIPGGEVRLHAKLHHVFNPNSQGSVALSGTAWVTIEFVYSYMTMFVIVTSVIIFLIDSMPEYYDSNPYYRLKSACMLASYIDCGAH